MTIICSLSIVFSVSADTFQQDSTLLRDFLSDIDDSEVQLDIFGIDDCEECIDIIYELHKCSKYDELRQYIYDNDVVIVKTSTHNDNSANIIGSRAAQDSVKTVIKEFYELESNTTGIPNVKKEWITKVTASILYSNNTNEVKQAWSTVVAANVNFGDSFSVNMSDVNINSTVNSTKTTGVFSGSYKLTGTFSESLLNSPVSFGPVSYSFTVTP